MKWVVTCSLLFLIALSSGWAQTHPESSAKKLSGSAQESAAVQAADTDSNAPPENMDPMDAVQADPHTDAWRYLTSYEFALAVLVLIFGFLVIVGASITLRGTAVSPEQALRFYGVIVILVGTILLIVAGLNNNQIAPAIGLFGTLAGYLLGRSQSPGANPDTNEKSTIAKDRNGGSDENRV